MSFADGIQLVLQKFERMHMKEQKLENQGNFNRWLENLATRNVMTLRISSSICLTQVVLLLLVFINICH